jgi:hypothetical protein
MPDSGDNGNGYGPSGGLVSVLENRINTLDRQQRDLASDIASLGGQMERSLKAAVDSFGRQMDALSTKVDERSKIPWPALGVMLSFITIIGGLVWYPVKTQQERLETLTARFAENAVTKSDLDYRLNVTGQRRDDYQRQNEIRSASNLEAINSIRDKIVPRGEHEEKWRAADQRFNDVQRQLEEVKRAFGDTFSLRDALQSMQKRIDGLETANSALRKQ